MLQLTIKMINELNNKFMFFQFGIIAVYITKALRRKKILSDGELNPGLPRNRGDTCLIWDFLKPHKI